MKKLLMISPIPTHPVDSGNRVHIQSLAKNLIAQNWDVHFLHLAYDDFDEEALRLFWGDRLHVINQEIIFSKHQGLFFYIVRIYFKMMHIFRWIQWKLGIHDQWQYGYNKELDETHYLSNKTIPIIKNLQKEHHFKAVICEFVYMSKVLTLFDKNTLKIIDTNDKFTDRFKIFLDNNVPPYAVSLYKDQEKKALNRADLVLAVNDSEVDFFSSISKTKVVLYNYIPDISKLPEKKFEKKLLYLASDNPNNHAALDFIVCHVLPLLLEKHPDVQLLIGGGICETYRNNHPNVHLLGIFDKLADFYAQGDIFINPEQMGTGYKIKTIEALSFCLPVVATTLGAAGASEPFLDHLFIADTPIAFAEAVSDLLEQPELREKMVQQAEEWIKRSKEKSQIIP
jgi:glycosyltransferase involved in cell wall biosynthesis